MMTDAPDLGKRLDELAETMLVDACKEATSLERKLEVFKILSAHHVNVEKLRGKREPSGAGGQTMAGLREQVANGSGSPQPLEDTDDQTDPDQSS